jgi:ribonuclease HII
MSSETDPLPPQTNRESMLLTRWAVDEKQEIGVDEAGRGSFWGPLMAGAVCLPDETIWTPEQRALFQQLRDSKRISPKKRMTLYHQLIALVPQCAVGEVSAVEINERGIQWANKEAFQRAVKGLIEKREARAGAEAGAVATYRLLMDGTLSMSHMEDEKQETVYEEHLIVNGDDRYLAIAAASILAKVRHDLWIQAYCAEHPDVEERYDLVKSKGYGTGKHREGIQRYGGHELHRVVYIQYWLPGRQPRTSTKRNKSLDFTTCLIQTDGLAGSV